MTGVTITAHDPQLDSDDDIAELVALGNVIRAEILPDDAPQEVQPAIAGHRAMPARLWRWSFRARTGAGELIGVGSCRIDPEHDDNPDLLELSLHVLSEHRRRGIGTRLLAALVEVAVDEGRDRLLGNVIGQDAGGTAFAAAVGGELRHAEHINHLPVDAVDRDLMGRWVDDGPSRAPEYDLIAFDGACPDEHLDGLVHLVTVLNDAPRDDLDVNDMTVTAGQVRESEAVTAASGREQWTLLARHRSGDYAGLHNVTWDPNDPAVVWVGLTTVDPAHRGHALGKWLKAAMTLRILDDRPSVTDIRTGNADSNDAMLGINRAMGYRSMLSYDSWMAMTEDVRTWLDAKGAFAAAGSPA